MQRGHFLESELDRVIEYLNSIGVHGHKNHARRTVDGTYLEGEPFDYEVLVDGVLHCFDAKESKTDKWALSNAKPLQVKHLQNCKKHGAEAYFLVYFASRRKLKRFDVDVVIEEMKNKSYLTPDKGGDWDWTELRPSKKK